MQIVTYYLYKGNDYWDCVYKRAVDFYTFPALSSAQELITDMEWMIGNNINTFVIWRDHKYILGNEKMITNIGIGNLGLVDIYYAGNYSDTVRHGNYSDTVSHHNARFLSVVENILFVQHTTDWIIIMCPSRFGKSIVLDYISISRMVQESHAIELFARVLEERG